MRQKIHGILWVTIVTTTVIFWFYIYKAWTSEYDENVNSLVLAVLIAIFTLIILIYLIFKDKIKNKLKTFLKYLILFLGTPITLVFLGVYVTIFQMNFVSLGYSTKSGKTYQIEKHRNYFKAENILIDENLSQDPDTIIGIILRNGTIDNLFKIDKGDTFKISKTDIEYLTTEQKRELTTY